MTIMIVAFGRSMKGLERLAMPGDCDAKPGKPNEYSSRGTPCYRFFCAWKYDRNLSEELGAAALLVLVLDWIEWTFDSEREIKREPNQHQNPSRRHLEVRMGPLRLALLDNHFC